MQSHEIRYLYTRVCFIRWSSKWLLNTTIIVSSLKSNIVIAVECTSYFIIVKFGVFSLRREMTATFSKGSYRKQIQHQHLSSPLGFQPHLHNSISWLSYAKVATKSRLDATRKKAKRNLENAKRIKIPWIPFRHNIYSAIFFYEEYRNIICLITRHL